MPIHPYYDVVGPSVHYHHHLHDQRQHIQQQLRGSWSRALQEHPQQLPDASQNDRIFADPRIDSSDPQHATASPLTVTLCVLFVLLMCWCTKPNIPDARFRKDRSYWMEGRIRRINRSLHIRRIVAVDEAGNFQLGEEEQQQPTNSATEDVENGCGDEERGEVDNCSRGSSIHTEDENNEVACCSICLETYRVGDKVAWTARPPAANSEEMECLHVFHHECILAWLESPKNDDCPTCRAKVMLDNEAASRPKVSRRQREQGQQGSNSDQGDTKTGDEEKEDDDDHGSVGSAAFFIMHGLIARARRASYTLVGQIVSVDKLPLSNSEIPLTAVSVPSPFRRAQTFGSGFGGNLLFQRQGPLRRRLRSTSVSEHSLSSSTQEEADIHFVFTNSSMLESSVPGPVSLRRVATAGPSTPVRSNVARSRTETSYRSNQSEHYLCGGTPKQSMNRNATATTTEGGSLDLPELSSTSGSSDSLLGRSLSLTRSASLICQQSSTGVMLPNSSTIREEYEREPVTMADDFQGLHSVVVMRQSVSWARDIADCDTVRSEEDDILL